MAFADGTTTIQRSNLLGEGFGAVVVTAGHTAKQEEGNGDLYKALTHELRVEILTYLTDHATASPSEMAEALGASVKEVSHHTKQLVRYKLAELVEVRRSVKGTDEHVYRALARVIVTEDEAEELPALVRDRLAGQQIKLTLKDIRKGEERKAFCRSDHHTTRMLVSLDAKGWEEMRALHERTFYECFDIQARSDQRRAKSGEGTVRASVSQMAFVIPDSAD